MKILEALQILIFKIILPTADVISDWIFGIGLMIHHGPSLGYSSVLNRSHVATIWNFDPNYSLPNVTQVSLPKKFQIVATCIRCFSLVKKENSTCELAPCVAGFSLLVLCVCCEREKKGAAACFALQVRYFACKSSHGTFA